MGSREAVVDPELGTLSRVILEALKVRAQMKADGASPEDLAAGFERVVRGVWPFEREWKYLCDRCLDYGLVMGICPGDATCGLRPSDLKPRPAHEPHEIGSPCWCSAGNKFKLKPRSEQDFTAATKSKPRPMTRWGK